MALLTVEGFEVPVIPGTEIDEPEHGDYARAYSGKMRSDIRARHRAGRILATYFSTDNDAPALLAILRSPGPVLCGGTLIGDDAYFHARAVRSTPITADLLQVAFELHETDETPSALLFSFDGDAPGTYTYTRTGTARYGTATGTLALAAANVLRRDWLWTDGTYVGAPDTAAALIEAARTNLVTSDNFDSGWTSSGTPVITSNVDDPAGGTGAYRIEDNDGAGNEYKYLSVTFTTSAVKSVVFVVRQGTMASSGTQDLNVADTGASQYRLVLAISAWTAGVPTVSGSVGTYLGKRYVGNGYWALYGLTTSVTHTNAHVVEIRPAGTASATGTIDVFRVNVYESTTMPSWSIQDASEAGSAGTLYAPISFVPQTLTVYVKLTEAGSLALTSAPVLHIGGSTITTNERLTIQSDGTYYNAIHGHADGNVIEVHSVTPTWGDTVELRVVLQTTGVTLGQSINSGTEVVGTEATARAYRAAWASPTIYIGGPATFAQAPAVIEAVRIVTGVRTMDEMRDWAGARLNPRLYPGGAVRSLSASVASTAAASAVEAP